MRTSNAGLLFFLFFALSILSCAVYAAGGNPQKGKILAQGCICHRGDLNGMSEEVFIRTLHGFKDGTIKNKNMNEQAKKYSDEQIRDLAAWFSSQ